MSSYLTLTSDIGGGARRSYGPLWYDAEAQQGTKLIIIIITM